jgi:DNA-3-methyladenine glycosylase I
LRKRENLRKVFHQFDYRKVALYKKNKIEELMRDSGLIRNKLKIEATINNAQCLIEFEKNGDSFSDYLWSFVNHKTLQNNYEKLNLVPTQTALSSVISKALKKHGFKFVGPKIVYSHMQASGLVNDHLKSCFRHKQLKG